MGRDNNPGRGRGRGGQSGRGSGGWNNRKKTKNSSTTKDREYKFAPQTYGKSPGHTYATIKDHICNYIQKNWKGGHDIAKSLEDSKKVDLANKMPQRVISLR